MNTEQRLEVFKAELEAISDNRVREFTKLCLAEGPDYFHRHRGGRPYG